MLHTVTTWADLKFNPAFFGTLDRAQISAVPVVDQTTVPVMRDNKEEVMFVDPGADTKR